MDDEERKDIKGRFPNWCLTMWNHKRCKGEFDEEFEVQQYKDGFIEFPENKVRYIVYGLEKCPSTNKLHMHVYVEFTEKVSRKWIKENFNDNTLWANPRNGTQRQAIDYVCKDETKVLEDCKYKCWGEKKQQGNRSDLDTMVEAIEQGMTSKEMLIMFRGNGLRHMGMIQRGLEAYHGCNKVDNLILEDRELRNLENA